MLINGPFGAQFRELEMNLAIDSYPLNTNIHKAYDYSALQVLSLESEPLFKAIECFEKKDNRLEIVLKKPQSERYLKSMADLAGSNVFLKKLVFKNILGAKAAGKKLQLKIADDFDPKDLRLPNLAVPKPKGPHKLTMVHGPAQNHAYFEEGKIDFLCDTAIDLDKLDDSYGGEWTGLVGSLDYSSSFIKRPDFKSLKNIIESYRPSQKFEALRPLGLEREISESASVNSEITLAYDDFYPNFELISDLAKHLKKFGIKSKLVKDDYYRPSASYDLKFIITRPLGASNAYNWLWLFSFSDAVNIKKRQTILKRLKHKNEFDFGQPQKLELGFALFKIPSLFKKTDAANPLNHLLGDLYELDD